MKKHLYDYLKNLFNLNSEFFVTVVKLGLHGFSDPQNAVV